MGEHFGASLNIHRTKWESILVLVWSVTFSVLISALNVETLVKAQKIPVLDIASWLLNLLLLFCAFRLFRNLVSQNTPNELLSPPLLKEDKKCKTSSPKIGFLNRMGFSWMNPLLHTGYSKTLVLDDIPSLESEDEAQFAYELFAHQWDLQRNKSSSPSDLVLRALAKFYMKEMNAASCSLSDDPDEGLIGPSHIFLLDDELRKEDVNRIPRQNLNRSVRIQKGVFSWNPDATVLTLKGIDLEISTGQKIAICGPVGAGKSSLLYALLEKYPKSQDQSKFLDPLPIDWTRGLNLSGGQKQRLQLARAVYNDADIYLLDDPFSAVDAHTAATLFNDCVMTALEKKTVILVTRQVEFLVESDSILVMEGGHITQSGSYVELLKAGTAFEQLMNAHHDAMAVFESVNMEQMDEARKTGVNQMGSTGLQLSRETSEGEISVKGVSKIQLTQDEEKEIGNVGWKPYNDYIYVSKGTILFASLVLLHTLFVILQSASTYWLAIAIQIPHIGNAVLLGVYAGISTFNCISVYLRTLAATHLGLKASKEFFTGLMNSLFKAPILFFDSTPVGRILTRASSDLSVVDFDIPYATAYALTGAIEVVTTIIIMATVTWQVLIVAIPVTLVAMYVQGYYLATARELIRINGTTKAPVMNYAAETALGVATIRAFAMMESFIHNNLKLIDTDATLFFHTNAAMEWVLLRVEALQNLTIFTVMLLLVLLPAGTIHPGFVGLSISYALTLTSAKWF
ncbi:hypothetical protein AAC387_Pa02g0867 [Persea americana]